MVAVPWIFLDRTGRRRIGLASATAPRWYALAVVGGGVIAGVLFALWAMWFGGGADNAFASIGQSYRAITDTRDMGLLQLHLFFTVPALLFSPIGEEIFFRGFLQQALQERVSVRAATWLETGLFGLVHLCHHGLLLTAAGVTLRPVSGGLWVASMFVTALAFAALRRASGSLYPAIAAHMAFNVVMNALIFSVLWA